MEIVHNSHDIYYRDPFGAAICGTKINLKITADFNRCYIHIINFNDENKAFMMDKGDKEFTYILDTSKYLGTNFYYFELFDDYENKDDWF